ncbi:hypothetical protein AB0C44_00770 [Micromonospora taraxaci]|uniref:hypothetical protein n=1 Tax=Micromonospora taraxaci TaxID=1316803 RepID=UPI0034083B51
MSPWTLDEVDRWLGWIHQRHNEFDYRYIYLAYLAAGAPVAPEGEITVTVHPDGSCLLRAGADDRGLVLAGDQERERLAEHLRRRYCGDRYPSMRAWETAQHGDFLDEIPWRFGGR